MVISLMFLKNWFDKSAIGGATEKHLLAIAGAFFVTIK